MNLELRRLLETSRIASRQQILAVVGHHVLDQAVRSGAVNRPFARVYTLAEDARNGDLRLRAALRVINNRGALSHLTALALWGLPAGRSADVHVTIPANAGFRSLAGLHIHRRDGFAVGAPFTVTRRELEVVRLERAVVESWPLITDPYLRRQPMIAAVGQRLTTPDRLSGEAAAVPNIKGRASLLDLLELLSVGCRSQLEIHGYLHVFAHRLLPAAQLQLPVRLKSRTIYLDVAFAEEMLNFELDGPQYHPERARDHVRDADLAAVGWQTIRWSPTKLNDPEQARAEAIEIRAIRRRQLGLPPL